MFIFLQYRQADLTASASLQGTRGEGPQFRIMCLASAATSACSSSRFIKKELNKCKNMMSL